MFFAARLPKAQPGSDGILIDAMNNDVHRAV
jgi:hypothetical protein